MFLEAKNRTECLDVCSNWKTSVVLSNLIMTSVLRLPYSLTGYRSSWMMDVCSAWLYSFIPDISIAPIQFTTTQRRS